MSLNPVCYRLMFAVWTNTQTWCQLNFDALSRCLFIIQTVGGRVAVHRRVERNSWVLRVTSVCSTLTRWLVAWQLAGWPPTRSLTHWSLGHRRTCLVTTLPTTTTYSTKKYVTPCCVCCCSHGELVCQCLCGGEGGGLGRCPEEQMNSNCNQNVNSLFTVFVVALWMLWIC